MYYSEKNNILFKGMQSTLLPHALEHMIDPPEVEKQQWQQMPAYKIQQ